MEFIIILIIALGWGLICSIPARMAQKRGRNYFAWLIISLVFSPIIAVILVLLLGETDERRIQKIIEEEEIRKAYRDQS